MSYPDERAVLARASALLDLKRPSEARALLLPLIATEGASAEVWCHLAMADLAMGSWHWAQQAADRAIVADPDGEWGYRLRSRALGELGLHAPAVAAAERAVALAPFLWITHVQLSEALCSSGSGLTRGLAEAERAVELAPYIASTHLAVGIAAAGLRRDDEATAAYERVLELDPGNSAAMNNLGVLALRRTGGAGKAARHFVGSLRANPSQRPAASNVALAGRVLLARLTALGAMLAVVLAFGWRFTPDEDRLVLVLGAVVLVGAFVVWVVVVVRGLPAGVLRSAWPGWRQGWWLISIPLLAAIICSIVLTANGDELGGLWLPIGVLVARLGTTFGLIGRRRRR